MPPRLPRSTIQLSAEFDFACVDLAWRRPIAGGATITVRSGPAVGSEITHGRASDAAAAPFAPCRSHAGGAPSEVAYEPVWAISKSGSNLEATSGDVVTIHAAIRTTLDEMFGSAFGAATSVIFGGSIDTGNAATYLRQSEIDGALVGAGMQTAPGFLGVLDAFYQSAAD